MPSRVVSPLLHQGAQGGEELITRCLRFSQHGRDDVRDAIADGARFWRVRVWLVLALPVGIVRVHAARDIGHASRDAQQRRPVWIARPRLLSYAFLQIRQWLSDSR